MQVATIRLSLFIRQARSLKDKRSVVKGLKDRLHNRFNASVSEIDRHDNIQIAVLGVAIAGSDSRHLKSVMDTIENFVRAQPLAELTSCDKDIIY